MKYFIPLAFAALLFNQSIALAEDDHAVSWTTQKLLWTNQLHQSDDDGGFGYGYGWASAGAFYTKITGETYSTGILPGSQAMYPGANWANAGLSNNRFSPFAPYNYPPGTIANRLNTMASLSELGVHGKPDYAAAAQLYREAAEQGSQEAQSRLAIYYADGRGVKQDYEEAYFWYLVSDARLQKTISRLTSEQKASAEKRFADWKKAHPDPGCEPSLTKGVARDINEGRKAVEGK